MYSTYYLGGGRRKKKVAAADFPATQGNASTAAVALRERLDTARLFHLFHLIDD